MTHKMTRSALFICAVLVANTASAYADGPRGFRIDWKRAETSIADALDAARSNDLDEMRDAAMQANDAMLDLSTYAEALQPDNRTAYINTLNHARVTAQRVINPGAAISKDEGIRLMQNILQDVTTTRTAVPADWFKSGACTGMRKQRHQC